MDIELYLSISQTRIEAADAAEYYRKRAIDNENTGDTIKAELNRQKFVASAKLANMYNHLVELLEAGYSKEQAVELANYYGELNEFRAKQRGWLTMVSPEAVEVLTAPIGA